MNPWEQDWSSPQPSSDAAPWEQDWNAPEAEAAAAAEEGERPGFFSQVGNQLLSGDANEMATGYATTINELRNYDALPWYKRAKYPSDPAEREAKVNELLPELERWTQNIAQYESERAAPTAGQRAISEAPTLGAALKTAAANPGDALGLVGPSAAASLIDLPQVVAAGLTMGPKGAATAAGVSAYGQDYKASVLDGLRDIGVDPSSAPMLMEAMQKADALIASQEAAKKRAMVVGGASALGTAVAGKMLTPFMKAGVGREVANVGVQIPTQAVIEGGGEALAQQASGEGYKPGEVAAEMLGGGVTAPVDVAQAAVAGYKQKGPDTQGLAAAAQARAAYEATFTQTDDGQGGTTFVDGAGNPVGDTLDEARATAARLTPEELAGRMQAAPAAPAATPAAPAQPEPAPSPMQRGKPRIEPTLEPPVTEETSNEADVRQPAADIPADGAGDAVRLSRGSEADGNSPDVGSGPDMGRVPGVSDNAGGTVGETAGRGEEAATVVDGRKPDTTLNLGGKTRVEEARDYLVNNKVSLDYPPARIAEMTGITEQEAATVVADLRANPPTATTERQDGTTSVAEDGMTLVHGSNRADLTPASIEIVRNDGQKQGKKGRVYGGFYAAPESDAAQAVNYANMGVGTPTVYDVRVKPGTKVLNKTGDITRLSEAYINELASQGYGVVVGKSPLGRTEYVVIDKNAIESMAPRAKPASPMLRGEPAEDGLPVPRNRAPSRNGKTASWVVRDKQTGATLFETFEPNVVRALNKEKYEAVPIQDHLADINKAAKPAAQPAAAPTQEQRNEEVSPQGQEPQGNGTSGSQVRGEQAQAQEEIAQPAEPASEFTSDTGTVPDAAPATSEAWKGKKGAARLQALVSKTKDVAPDAYEDARLPGYMGEAVDAMARLFKKDVVVFRAKPGTAYAPGGLLFPADASTIYLNADANVAPAVVFMHEMVHSMKRTDPKTYAALEKAVGKLLKNKKGYVEFRLRGKALPDELVTEEMIADVMADHASTPQFWSDLYERFNDKSAWAKFVEHVRLLLSNVIDTLYPIGANNYISDFNAAYQAVVDAAYNHARAQHGDVASDGQAMEMPAGSQTDTPEFKRWFGDSKVVDEQGKPLTVYHGTTANVAAFDPARRGSDTKTKSAEKGFFFTSSPRHASVYANGVTNTMRNQTRDGANVVPVYVQVSNPKVIVTRRPVEMEVDLDDGKVIQAAIDAGHDGIIVSREVGDEYDVKLVIAFRPTQIKSASGNNGNFDPNNPDILESAMLSSTQGSPPSQSLLDEGNAYWRAGAKMWDNLNRMRILQEKAVERGLQLRDEMNVWVRENLSRSKMRVMADDVTEKFQEPILKTMKQASLTLKQVDDYLMALHAPERNAQVASINPKFPDGGSGMTNAEAAATLAAFTPAQTTALRSISQKVKDLQAYKLNVMETYGLMETADIQRLQAMYQNYVPLKTIDEEQTSPGQTGRGLDIRGAEVKAALGRGSRATSPLMVSFQDMARTLVRAHKNEAGNALLELTRDPVLASMRTPQGKPIISIANPADFARPVTDSQGQVSVAVPGNWWQDEEVFVTKENGVPQYIHVRDPELMAQLRRMGDSEMGPAIRAIGQGTRLFARMLTQYNPVFAPVNIIRDAIQASILSLGVPGLNPLKVMAGVLPNLGRIMAHGITPNTRYQEFLEDGGSTNAYGLNDLNDALADVQALGISLGYGAPATGAWDKAWKAINAKRKAVARTRPSRAVFDTLTWWNEAFENAVRLSTYNAMRNAGISRDQAAFQSKELSTNFNKKGTLSSALNAVYVFVNAAMQGNRALVRFWKESGKVKTAFAGLVFAGVMQDILGSLFGGDDDESGLANIDEVGDWALDHNIVLPTGQNEQVKIPLPYGINLPFVLGRRISKAIRTGDGLSQMSGILNVMADNFSPIGGFEAVKDQKTGDLDVSATLFKTVMPSLMRPGFSVVVNSNFMGAPIAKEPFQGDKSPAPRAYDFKPGTADYAVKLSELMNEWSGGNVARPGDVNVSPEHIQYLIGEYSGGAGRFVSDVTDMTTKAVKGKSEDIDFSKAPFVRSFFSTDSRSDAYSRYREISTRVAYLKDEKAARVEVDPKYRAIAKTVDRAEDELKALRKLRKAAYAKDDMAKVREIQEKETTIIKGVVKRFNDQQGK